MKSFRPKNDGTPPDPPEPPAGGTNAEVDFHGQRLSNDTRQSTTDPEARLYRKGRGARPGSGLIVDGRVMLGADKGYDAEDFVNELRSMDATPHITRNTAGRRSALDGRTARHPGYG